MGDCSRMLHVHAFILHHFIVRLHMFDMQRLAVVRSVDKRPCAS